MEKENLDKLLNLRKFLIKEHNSLDGKTSPTTAIIRQIEVARIIEHTIRQIDDVLKDHVKFE